MKDRNFRIVRRNFLAGMGTTGAAAFLRPLIAQAQSPTGSPQRILLIHRPCGSEMTKWWPTGGVTDWVSSPLISSFDKLRSDMVIMKGVDCPRMQQWLGDKHGAGMIAMVAPPPKDKGSDLHVWPVLPGYTPAQQEDTNAKFFTSTDKTIEQLFLEKIPALKGTVIPSVQLTSSTESADSRRDCCLRVVSYSKPDPAAQFPTPLWPESRPSVAFMNIFGKVTGMDPAQVARIQAQNKSVLDFITGGLNGLRPRLPASQAPKIDAHMTALRDLERNLNGVVGGGPGRQCLPPTLGALPPVASGISRNDTEHYASSLQQMQIIKTMFQCDLTRVASFTFGYGNSGIAFANVLKVAGLLDVYKDTKGGVITDTEGHHNLSHNAGTGYREAQYIVDKVYCDITAKLLEDMKATPDGIGPGSLLDNTLVVFWNECSEGNPHAVNDMPVLAFGGKFLKLQGGKYIQFGNRARTMADFWTQTAQAWGHTEMTSYGDAMWNKGAMPGIYG
jgi:hypothetical protein